MVAAGYGRIVNVASVAGKDGNPFVSAYAASKAAQIAFTKSLGKELADKGVLVNAVTPSASPTEIFGALDEARKAALLANVPMRRFVEPEEVARAFDELGYRRYEWKCDDLHVKSRAAASRLGFTYEGTHRQARIYKGRNRDTAWYSVIDTEWPRLRDAFEAWLDPSNFDDSGVQKTSLAT